MGVDVRIMVNARARIRDVADVIAILAGKKAYKRPFESSFSHGWSAEVDDVEYRPSKHMAECAEIVIKSSEDQPLVDGHDNHWVLWHWEPCEKYHCHVMQPPSTPFWIAVGKGLVAAGFAVKVGCSVYIVLTPAAAQDNIKALKELVGWFLVVAADLDLGDSCQLVGGKCFRQYLIGYIGQVKVVRLAGRFNNVHGIDTRYIDVAVQAGHLVVAVVEQVREYQVVGHRHRRQAELY